LQDIWLDLDFTGAGRRRTSGQQETQKKRQPQQFTRFGQNITSIDRRSNFNYTQDGRKSAPQDVTRLRRKILQRKLIPPGRLDQPANPTHPIQLAFSEVLRRI
jgi:hypothetical protein